MSTTLAHPRTTPAPHGQPATPASAPRAGARARLGLWRLGLPLLLAATAALYLWDLAASGWANAYYAAAAQAGGSSWKALLFGSLDAAGSITVDKPPASLWAMGLSVRAFGLSSWSLLVPQALMGVAAVGLLAATVRRVAGPAAGLVAGLVLAATPVAALMFRFDNPDALLTLLLVAAAWATTRALATGRLALLGLAGSAVGLAFLTKMLQAFLVLPALALVVLVAFPGPVRRRLAGLAIGILGVVATAGPYLALVEWWPFGARPYIGGSQGDSILELTLGYNGLERLSGSAGPGGGGGGMGGTAFGGEAGLTRLLGDSMGTQIGWLVPASLVAILVGLWTARRAPRLDPTRAAVILWGGWLVVSGLVFSLMSGIVHPYYTVALAPAIGALVAIGGGLLLARRAQLAARVALAATAAGSAAWAAVLLDRTPDWQPWLRPLVLAGGVAAAAVALVPPARLRPRLHGTALAATLAVALLAAPVAFTLSTVTTAHAGSIPMAGPTAADGGGAPGAGAPGAQAGQGPPTGAPPQAGQLPRGAAPQGGTGGGQAADAELVALVAAEDDATWPAATVGAQGAAALQLASGRPVMAIGGFSGSDPSPTLEAFQALVADGAVRYLVAGGGMGGPGGGAGGGSGSAILSWAAATFTATTVGGQTVYDLAQPLA